MNSDYERIARSIDFIRDNVDLQPGLDEVAAHVGLSPYHFQRLFQRWAGVSPKRFLEFLTVEQAKKLLKDSHSVLESSLQTGLSGPGRLHDQFVSIEAVSPGEFKNQGEGIKIEYGHQQTPFGRALVALSPRGILALSFCSSEEQASELKKLQDDWPNAKFLENSRKSKETLSRVFSETSVSAEQTVLAIRGTNFQVKVWNALLDIAPGSVSSYRAVAEKIGKPRAVRAVANAVGANPVAYLIPCHRVLRSTGELSGYRWGPERKRLMLAREWSQAASQ